MEATLEFAETKAIQTLTVSPEKLAGTETVSSAAIVQRLPWDKQILNVPDYKPL